jgi:hypothetical protein
MRLAIPSSSLGTFMRASLVLLLVAPGLGCKAKPGQDPALKEAESHVKQLCECPELGCFSTRHQAFLKWVASSNLKDLAGARRLQAEIRTCGQSLARASLDKIAQSACDCKDAACATPLATAWQEAAEHLKHVPVDADGQEPLRVIIDKAKACFGRFTAVDPGGSPPTAPGAGGPATATGTAQSEAGRRLAICAVKCARIATCKKKQPPPPRNSMQCVEACKPSAETLQATVALVREVCADE